MFRLFILAVALVTVQTPVFAADPLPAAAPAIQFPGVVPTPATPVLPDAVTALPADRLFVVTSDQPFALIGSPARLVKITLESGPLRIRAAFADGSGVSETRNYTAKYIAIVEAAGEGRVELIGIPNGFTDEGDFTRRLVDCGKAPQPPPKPEPTPDPTPVDPAPVGPLRIIMAFESSANSSREQLNILHSTAITAWMNANTAKGADGRPSWRKWDADVVVSEKEDPELAAIWKAAKPQLGALPRLIIAQGKQVTIKDFPATEADSLAMLKGLVK